MMVASKGNTVLEGAIEIYLLDQCRKHHFLCLKFISPPHAGVPDRLVIAPSRTVFVEVKRPGAEPTKLQLAQHAKMRSYGAQIYVVDDRASVDALMADLAAHGQTDQKAAS